MNGNRLDLITVNAQRNHKQHTFEHRYFWAMPLEKPRRGNQSMRENLLFFPRRRTQILQQLLEHLEICTSIENHAHKLLYGLYGLPTFKICLKFPVQLYQTEYGLYGPTTRDKCDLYGLANPHMSSCTD
jgi:hypothetical protein